MTGTARLAMVVYTTFPVASDSLRIIEAGETSLLSVHTFFATKSWIPET